MTITGRRPATSLRLPHAGLTNTHSDAEVAKISDTWNGEMPISRAAGGRIENSIDCPMPIEIRQAKSSASSRLNTLDARVSFACWSIRAILADGCARRGDERHDSSPVDATTPRQLGVLLVVLLGVLPDALLGALLVVLDGEPLGALRAIVGGATA